MQKNSFYNIYLMVFILILISSGQPLYSQSFLDAYKKYRIHSINILSNQKSKKRMQQYIQSHFTELDTVFKSYKAKTGFDFNHADSLFLIYDSPAETPFTGDVIIWSGKDTIYYRQGFEMIETYAHKKIITYIPPSSIRNNLERDSLLTLVSKHDFYTINHLGDNQSIEDGNYIHIYIVRKTQKSYTFETCFPPKFIIW